MIVNGLPATEKRLEEIKHSQEQDETCRDKTVLSRRLAS